MLFSAATSPSSSSLSMWSKLVCSLLVFSASVAASPTPQAAPTKCNGYAEFCNRPYSQVSVIGAHNSYSVGAGNPAANQNYSVLTQLNSGVRLLQVQGILNSAGILHLCHTSCALLDYGTFTSYLSIVNTWLIANPSEVITLLLVNGNSPTVLASTWAQSFSASGLINYVYTPTSLPVDYSHWPTLGSMISAGTRVVAFLAQNADVESVPYLIDEFTHVWETPFDQTDPSFPCIVDRVTGSSTGKMYLINHFLDVNVTILGSVYPVPARNALQSTNGLTGLSSLPAQSSACFGQHGYIPTFTLVDYFDVGNVFQYAATLNQVPYIPIPIVATGSSGSSGSTNSAGGATTSGNGAVTSTPLGGAAAKVVVSKKIVWACSAMIAVVAGGMWTL